MAYTLADNINLVGKTPPVKFPFFYPEDINDVIKKYPSSKKPLKFKIEYAECEIDPDGNPVSPMIPTVVLIVLDKDENRLINPNDWVILGCLPYARKGVLPKI